MPDRTPFPTPLGFHVTGRYCPTDVNPTTENASASSREATSPIKEKES